MSITPFSLPPSPKVSLLTGEPSRPSARDPVPPERSPSPRGHATSVLVVDDDESIRDMLRAVLSEGGYSVRVASDGAAALAMVAAEPPSVVLLDMRMPRVDGREFVRRLRERGVRPAILAMTAGRDAATSADEIETDGFLAKPFDIDELLEKVSRFRDQPPN